MTVKPLLVILLFFTFSLLHAQQWEYGGVRNTAQKTAGFTGGEGGQWPQALAIDNSNGMFLLYGSDVGGLWRSTDGGKLWEPSNSGYTARGTSGVFIDPNDPTRALSVGANSAQAFFNDYHGLYMTTDKALTWRKVKGDNLCGYRDSREQIAYDASSKDAIKGYSKIIYWSRIVDDACGPATTTLTPGIYKSVDTGETWNFVTSSEAYGGSIIKVHPEKGFVYIANANGFFKSTNGATSFTKKFTGAITGMDVSQKDPSRIFVCTTNALFLSTDEGESFNAVTTTGFPSSVLYLKISPANGNYILIQDHPSSYSTDYYYSHDGGTNWSKANYNKNNDFLPTNGGRLLYPIWHPTNQNIAFGVGSDWITGSTDGGVNFSNKNDGASAMAVTDFMFCVDNPNYQIVTTQDYDVSVTTNGGDTWVYQNMSGYGWGGFFYGGYIVDDKTWFARMATSWNSPRTLRITFDGGKTYADKGDVSGNIFCYAVPGDKNILFCAFKRSTDMGVTWNNMTNCTGVVTHNPTGNKELYGINDKSVVKSTDKGSTWQTVATIPVSINDIAFDHVNNRIYAACIDNGLYQINAANGNATDITSKIPADQFGNHRIHTVAVDPQDPKIIYVGGHRDIYASDVSAARSTDGGLTWKSLTTDPRLNNFEVGMSAGRETDRIRVHPVTRYAYFGASCYGVWKMAAPTGTEIKDMNSSNIYFNFYPNPASSFITIQTSDKADITILNMLSNVVFHQIVNHVETIDISSLKEGVYIIRAVINGTIVNRQLVIGR